jgi:hypothetical protein
VAGCVGGCRKFAADPIPVKSHREEKQLARGKTYEPKVIIEHRNWA